MNHTKTAFVGLGILLIAAIMIALKFSPTSKNVSHSSSANSDQFQIDRTSKRKPDADDRDSSAVATDSNEVDALVSDQNDSPGGREAIIEKIQDAATSYDPRELSVIRPYLESEDPAIRDAAVNGMIVLGDASAGPMLREAAKKISSAEDAKKMEEAADYVELPSASLKEISDQLKKRRKQEDDTTSESE